MNEIITILIPTKNRCFMLKRAITSLLNQTYKNIKIIILDNNSQDETFNYCNSINDKRVILSRSNKDLSMLENWQRGLGFIKTNFFLRLDDDNFYIRDFIEKILKVALTNNFTVTFFNDIMLQNGNLISRWKIDSQIFELNYKQVLFLEFFMQTDSNFCLINYQKIKKIYSEREIYQTILPDRYLIYRLAKFVKNKNLKIGLSTTPGGYALIGHQNSIVEYKKIDYSNLRCFENHEHSDASGNIYLLKILVLKKFLTVNYDYQISKFIDKCCNSSLHFTTVAYLGHFFRLKKIKDLKDFKILTFYFFKIFTSIIKNPLRVFDGQIAIKKIFLIIHIFFVKIFVNNFDKKNVEFKNKELADKIVYNSVFIDFNKLKFKKNFSDYLNHIA